MTVDPVHVRDLFLDALEHPDGQQRDAFLDEACQGQPDLRRQVEILLQAHQQSGRFLDQGAPATSPTVDQSLGERPGSQIGPYKLLQQLGEGGMGAVYMAEQTQPVQRRVALKIIKPGMDSRQVIARFEAERQALALMDHPNIARVLDAGTTESGRPFFVMELVRGIPFTQYCDQQHLAPRERLELFIPVCQAVQHAHQKGVIHRDLKPSNILMTLVDGRPVPKVIDFGVAKAIHQRLTEKTVFTEYGQIVGTLEYMSPEQARLDQLDIDTRSDIYSLGVLLYELLTGATPFDRQRLRSAAFDELLRIIREEEPPRPSLRLSTVDELPSIAANRRIEPQKLSGLLRGDLDWIVMRALEKDRNRRYETANGLAADLRRYLNDEPVAACPPSAGYRFRKFARRHKASLTAGCLIAAALVAGAIVSAWQAVRASRAERVAHQRLVAEEQAHREADAALREAESARDNEEQARREAELQRKQAQANFTLARSAVDQYLNKVTDNELLRVPGMQQLREELLSAALQFYEKFGATQADSLELRQELASAQYRLGRIHSELGNREAAVAANARAIQEYEALRARKQTAADIALGLAHAYFAAARYGQAEQLCQETLKLEPKSAEARELLAQTYNDLAIRADQDTESLRYHQQAFSLREQLARQFPENAAYQADLGSTFNNLGVLLGKQGNSTEALVMYQRSVEYERRAYELAPHSILWGHWLATSLGNIASTLGKLGESEAALKSFQEMVAVRRKLVADNPHLPRLRGELGRAYQQLAGYSNALNQKAEATRLLRLSREVLENMPHETASELYQLAEVYAGLSVPAEPPAEDKSLQAELQRNAEYAIDMLRKAVDAGFRDAEDLKSNGAFASLKEREDFQQLLAGLEKLAQAEKVIAESQDSDTASLAARQEALQLVKQSLADHPASVSHRRTYAEALRSLGEVQAGSKKFIDAERSLTESIAVWRSLETEDGDQVFSARLGRIAAQIALANTFLAAGRGPDARSLYDQCFRELSVLWEEHHDDHQQAIQIAAHQRLASRGYGRLALWPLLTHHAREVAGQRRVEIPIWNAQLAILLQLADGEDALRSYCQVLLDHRRSGGQREWSSFEVSHLIRTNCLVDSLAWPAAEMANWAQQYKNPNPFWTALICAMAQYRAGQYSETLHTLDQAPVNGDFTAIDNDGNNLTAAYVYALAHSQLGHEAQARQQLSLAEVLWEHVCRESLVAQQVGLIAPFDKYWPNLAATQVLRQEAWHEVAGQTADESLIHLLQARSFYFLGDIERAERLLDEVMRHEAVAEASSFQQPVEPAGGDVLVWALCGRLLAEQGRPAEASFAKTVVHPQGKRPPLAVTPFSSNDAAALQQTWAGHLRLPVEFENSLGMTFRLVPPGRFHMGTPPEVRDQIVQRLRAEGLDEFLITPHAEEGYVPVFLTRPFYLGATEVTVGQFRQFAAETGYQTEGERQKMGGFAFRDGWTRHPSHIWKTPDRAWVLHDNQPVVHMSHNDAVAFCEWLSKREGISYSLPSEAQWEFACRAGSQSLYGTGDDSRLVEQIAWTPETLAAAGKNRAQPVGTKQANAFGLYDMLGNAWEHCRDGYMPGPTGDVPLIDPESPPASESGFVGRGGAWYRRGPVARCGHRVQVPANRPNDAGFGFRVAITVGLIRVTSRGTVPEADHAPETAQDSPRAPRSGS